MKMASCLGWHIAVKASPQSGDAVESAVLYLGGPDDGYLVKEGTVQSSGDWDSEDKGVLNRLDYKGRRKG